MNNIIDFISKINAEGLDKIISNPSEWPDIEKAQLYFETMSAQDKAKAQASLQEIVEKLDQEIAQMTKNKDLIQSDLKAMNERQEACISYLKSAVSREKRE